MGIVNRLFPWYNPKEDDMKDAHAEIVKLRSEAATTHVRKLAQQGRAAGLILEKARNKPTDAQPTR